MAKSLEDTAFYRYHRLLAFNEVGGDPAAPALDIAGFHRKMLDRAGRRTHGLIATATHDTKRGEDARARILALTELSDEWASMVGRWKTFNARLVSTNNGVRSPSVADEYMLYQALIGALPFDDIDHTFVARMQSYAEKACREAKLQTSWLNPDAAYEAGVRQFLAGILDKHQSSDFLQSLKAFVRRTSLIGALNSLSQITLKATIPGVPDFYQGTELWDLSLVDPDNRRPVDFTAREAILDAGAADMSALTGSWTDGRIKLAWIHHLLDMRARHSKVFTDGDFRPLTVEGAHRRHVIAFARTHRSEAIVVVALRHFAPFTDFGMTWPKFDNLNACVNLGNLTLIQPAVINQKLDLKRVLDQLPVAVLAARVSTRSEIGRATRLKQKFQKRITAIRSSSRATRPPIDRARN
jgi:(1->4)-alpha-D-glucan 1-alpha-D-glucosylmutase